MKNPLDGSRLKIDRAKRHIQDLDAVLGAFRCGTDYPNEVVIETDMETGEKVHKFRLLRPPPYGQVALIVGDAVNNLRAALDHAVYACALLNGHPNPAYRTCSFPFGKDEGSFLSQLNGCTSVPAEIRECLKRFRGYRGGQNALYVLNQMCNRDKHALITPTIVGFQDLRMAITRSDSTHKTVLKWNRTQNEFILLRTKSDVEYDLKLAVDIALDAPGFESGRQIVPLLDMFVDVVEHVLMALEADMVLLFPDAFSEFLFRSPQ